MTLEPNNHLSAYHWLSVVKPLGIFDGCLFLDCGELFLKMDIDCLKDVWRNYNDKSILTECRFSLKTPTLFDSLFVGTVTYLKKVQDLKTRGALWPLLKPSEWSVLTITRISWWCRLSPLLRLEWFLCVLHLSVSLLPAWWKRVALTRTSLCLPLIFCIVLSIKRFCINTQFVATHGCVSS